MKNFKYLLLSLFLLLSITFTITFVLAKTDVYKKIIENNFFNKKIKINSLSLSGRANSNITNDGFKRFVNDYFPDLGSGAESAVEENKPDNVKNNYLNFDAFFDKTKGYVNIEFSWIKNKQEKLKLDLETRFLEDYNSIYLIIKNFDINLNENDLDVLLRSLAQYSNLTLNFDNDCKKNALKLISDFKVFIDREIKGKWIEISNNMEFILILNIEPEEKLENIKYLSSYKNFKSYLIKYPIFTLKEVKSSNNELRKFKVILKKNNLLKLFKNFEKSLDVDSEKLNSEDIKNLNKIVNIIINTFNEKIGEIYIKKRNYEIKRLKIVLRQKDSIKTKYNLTYDLNVDVQLNSKSKKSISQPSNTMSFNEIVNKLTVFMSNFEEKDSFFSCMGNIPLKESD